MISFDHIVIAVNDLETAARRFREDCGIAFQPGGVHPGGTKNWRTCSQMVRTSSSLQFTMRPCRPPRS